MKDQQQIVALEAPIPGYIVVPLEVAVQAVPGGPVINLTGSVEEIHAQLVGINPNFDRDFAFDVSEVEAPNKNAGLDKRFGPVCGGGGYNWGAAAGFRIGEGISYLRGVGGQPHLSGGPGRCSRVSCSWNAAIWWCNDSTGDANLPGFNTIADCAQVIRNACEGSDGYVVGQNFVGSCFSLFPELLYHPLAGLLRPKSLLTLL